MLAHGAEAGICRSAGVYRTAAREIALESTYFRSFDAIPADARQALERTRVIAFPLTGVRGAADLSIRVHMSHVLTMGAMSRAGQLAAPDLRPGPLPTASTRHPVVIELIHDSGATPRIREVLFTISGTRYRARMELVPTPGAPPAGAEPRILVAGEWFERGSAWREGERQLSRTVMPLEELWRQIPSHESAHWREAGRLVVPMEHNRPMPAPMPDGDRAALEALVRTGILTTVTAALRQWLSVPTVLPGNILVRAVVENNTVRPAVREVLLTVGDRPYRFNVEREGDLISREDFMVWVPPQAAFFIARDRWVGGGRRYQDLTPALRAYLNGHNVEGETVVMPNGTRFTRASGGAWLDEHTGLIWSEASRETMNLVDAVAYCRSRGGELPSGPQIKEWTRSLGKDAAGELPDLFSYNQYRQFWSSRVHPDSYDAYAFVGRTGYVGLFSRASSDNYAVRCVSRR